MNPARGAILLAVTAAALLSMAAVAAAKPTFGVVPQDGSLPSGEDLDRMPRAGIGSVRLLASWAATEPSPGAYEWGAIDAMVRETTGRGLSPYFFLYGTPEWAARADGHRCREGACAVFAPRSPATRSAFAAFAGAAAERYGPGGEFWQPTEYTGAPCRCTRPRPVRIWQIWNEQNSKKYFAPAVSVPGYAAMLRGGIGADPGIRSGRRDRARRDVGARLRPRGRDPGRPLPVPPLPRARD